MTETSASVLELAAQIVNAHCAVNTVEAKDLATLIQTVYAAVSKSGKQLEDESVTGPEAPTPAAPVKKSVFRNYIVCLEDGKKPKMLKRHLQSSYGMTPEQYRERWKLLRHYQMVAPDYAMRRSVLAKERGLGRKPAAQDGL